MATKHEGSVLEERMAALDLSQTAAAENSHESVDVVDLLPGPIWHIIFCLLLLPPADSAQLQKQGSATHLQNRDFLGALQQGAGSTSCATANQKTASLREQHEKDMRRFGSSWPLLRCAMASKRLLHHIVSFSVIHAPMLCDSCSDAL
ncbi:unnamed protein product [Closterium sp. Naga37s-1]|nr:unnamed protein product [Closterium sp. Naga37s-1]